MQTTAITARGRNRVVLVFIIALSIFISGCPFEGNADLVHPGEEDDEIKVVVVINGTGDIADIRYGGKQYQIDITGQGGVLDPGSINILKTNQVSGNLFPPGFNFPDHLITFKVTGLAPGATIDVLLTFPTAFPGGSQYYKVTVAGYVLYANAVFNGNQVTLTLTDGQAGDLDMAQNGEILDPGGPALYDETAIQLTVYPDKLFLGTTNLNRKNTRPWDMDSEGRKGGGSAWARLFLNTCYDYKAWWVDAESTPSWLYVWPECGTGSSNLYVHVDTMSAPMGTTTTSFYVNEEGSNNRKKLKVISIKKDPNQLDVPFGSFETPANESTVQGSIAVTGWALDDVGVESVKVYSGTAYLGDATFVEGSRPDISQAYPDYPHNTKAGWGYMILTNFLPNNGNGTFTIEAKATDWEGNKTSLGTKTIMVDNENAVKPFGAIDTPTPGGTASGDSFVNQGWALTPQPNFIPLDGSTIDVYIDNMFADHPTYNEYNEEINEYFSEYLNSNGAGASYFMDTTAYLNGVHTIQWIAVDNVGNTDGIGSRYFTIDNTN